MLFKEYTRFFLGRKELGNKKDAISIEVRASMHYFVFYLLSNLITKYTTKKLNNNPSFKHANSIWREKRMTKQRTQNHHIFNWQCYPTWSMLDHGKVFGKFV